MNKGTRVLLLSLMSLAGNVFANSTDLNFIIGSSFSRLSNEQYIMPVAGLINSYVSNDPVKTRTFYGFGLDYNFDHLTPNPITLGLGVSVYAMGLSNITGIETPGINILPSPQDTLNYKIQTKNETLLFEPKLVYSLFHLQPYAFGGLGYARNTLRNFTESTVPGSLAVPAISPYTNLTQTTFAYEAGLGLQYILGEDKKMHAFLVHVEFRYLDLGKSRLGTALAQTTDQHIYVHNTNSIGDFGITYRL